MKQNTAMQEMIKWMDKHPVDITSVAYRKAKELLKKEEEQIKQAVWYGHDNKPYMIHVPENFASEYFNQTYNNQ